MLAFCFLGETHYWVRHGPESLLFSTTGRPGHVRTYVFIWLRNLSWQDWPSSFWGLVQLGYPDVGVFTARIVASPELIFSWDLFLTMTVLGCAITSVSSGLREFFLLNLQVGGCMQSLVQSSLPVLSWRIPPLHLQKSHQLFLVPGFPAQVSSD